MGIEVAEDDCVGAIHRVEDGRGVEGVSLGARRGRGHVAVEDDEGRATDDCVDAEDFQGVVGCRDARDVEVAEGDRVVYQNSQASTTATRSVLTDEIVITKGRATCRGGELGLLNTGDENIIVFEKISKFSRGFAEAVAVVLED